MIEIQSIKSPSLSGAEILRLVFNLLRACAREIRETAGRDEFGDQTRPAADDVLAQGQDTRGILP